MAVDILMPKLGMTMEEGKLVEWLKAEKDDVQKGDLLLVIESDKVTFEVESPGTGIVAILMEDGEGIPVGTILGLLVILLSFGCFRDKVYAESETNSYEPN